MLITKVKASGVTNLTDARYFAAREVEWLGFPVGANMEQALPIASAKTILEWVDGVKIVGEFDFTAAEEILQVQNILQFDAVQVGMFTPVEELTKLGGIAIIKEVVIGKDFSSHELEGHLQLYSSHSDYFLFDFHKTGITWADLQQNAPFPLDFIKTCCEKYRVILSMDFRTSDLACILETLRPHGISLSGKEEEKTGFKSFDELDEILDHLEIIE